MTDPWPKFMREGLHRAELALAEAEGLAEFYGRRASELRVEIYEARRLMATAASRATVDTQTGGEG